MPATTKSTSHKKRNLTPWELPWLLKPIHEHRQPKQIDAKDRPHFPKILEFVYRNRYAVASQIQRRFPDHLHSDRTTRRHLLEMQQLGYLDIVPTNNTSPLWPKVYFITKRGLRRLQQSFKKKGRTWNSPIADRKRSTGTSVSYVLHEVSITEFLLNVWTTVEHRGDLELLSVQRRELVTQPAFEVRRDRRKTRLEPDGLFLFHHEQRGMMCCLLEIDLGTRNKKSMERKFQRYRAWKNSEAGRQFLINLYRQHGSENPKPAFRILMVSGESSGRNGCDRLSELLSLGETHPSLLPNLWFTSFDQLRQHQTSDTPLSEPIWIRGRDVSKETTAKIVVNEKRANFFKHRLLPD